VLLDHPRHDRPHQFLNKILSAPRWLASELLPRQHDLSFDQFLRQVPPKIVRENYQNLTNLLHMSQLIQWRVVSRRQEPYVFLDDRYARIRDWDLLTVRRWLWHETQHGKEVLHHILLDLSVAET
jgi:hypothetical protein